MKETARHRSDHGFSLIELLVSMLLFSVLLVLSIDSFPTILRQSGEQTKIIAKEIESIVGLDILRTDLEYAGYGLPWSFQTPASITYSEADSDTTFPKNLAESFNDSPSGVPRAIITGNNSGQNNSDYLVIKSPMIGRSQAVQRWTYIVTGSTSKTWTANNFDNSDRVIVIRPGGVKGQPIRELIMEGTEFHDIYGDISATNFGPSGPGEKFILYGVDPDTNLRMPFNRSDYYIRIPGTMPAFCAPGTGILYKAVVNHSGGGLSELPVLDCVADFQVLFRLDTNDDGFPDSESNDISALSAQAIREQVKEIRVYILTHEGKGDKRFTWSSPTITLAAGTAAQKDVNLSSVIGSTYTRYRWKTYTLNVKPKSLF